MLAALLLPSGVSSAYSGIAATPPMGWRNWNAFQGHIDQPTMHAQMAALTARTRRVVGLEELSSLADAGYARAGLDDNWQACGAGVGGSFHDGATGAPLVNASRFPDMKAMVDYGHSLGLKVGWYDNNWCVV